MLEPCESTYISDAAAQAARVKHVFGQVPLSDGLLNAHRLIDAAFLRVAAELQAREYRFPSFIKAEHLKKLDYLHSFPQHATFPQVLCCDDSNYQQFRNGDVVSADNRINVTNMESPQAILTPAACYHFYIHWQDSVLEETRFLTTKNTCYRNEKEYIPLERQWSFTMREIVCMGDEAQVVNFLENMKKRLATFFAKLPFALEWQVATDPFFNPDNSPKHLMQKLQPNKHEIVFDNRLAIGSANYHRSYFGETFNIRINGNYVHSACVAFGIERWLAAFMAHFGPNCEDWPMLLMEEL